MASVTLEHVTKTYGTGVKAVDDLSLDIEDGEFIVLVGPSGCGKTTTLRCVAGLEELTAGTIRIGDRVVNRLRARDRNVAMVFESYALYPHMTVFDNLGFALESMKTPKREVKRRVHEAARIVELEDLLDRKPKALSRGQQQRVALARAIVREPAVFLMDEPLSNVDAQLRVQTRAEILQLQQLLGITTIYVTHDQIEAMTMGERIAVIANGVLQQVGKPSELYNDPVNVFVAAFIGAPAMNFAPAKIGDGSVELGGGTFALSGRAGHAAAQATRGDVLVGFRPEDLVLDGETGSGAVRITARVDAVEYLGREELLRAQTGGQRIVALVPSGTNVRVGDNVRFCLPSEKLHLFDPETKRSLAKLA
jgi:multiple sugar transport system ATP-binding protein